MQSAENEHSKEVLKNEEKENLLLALQIEINAYSKFVEAAFREKNLSEEELKQKIEYWKIITYEHYKSYDEKMLGVIIIVFRNLRALNENLAEKKQTGEEVEQNAEDLKR